MTKLKSKNKKTRLEQLRQLRNILAEAIDDEPGPRDLAQLSKQYRETILEIEQIEGAEQHDDDIADLLSARKADGLPGAVRKDRS